MAPRHKIFQHKKRIAAWALGLGSFVAIPGQVSLGYLSDRIGREWVWAIANLGFAVCCLALILLQGVPSPWLLYVMVIGQGLGYGMSSVLGALALEIFQGAHFGAIYGTLTVSVLVGGAVGPWITGVLHDVMGNYVLAFAIAIALAALEKGQLHLTPQPTEGATYAAKITKSETRVDWTRPWNEVNNHCRGLSPFPGTRREFPGAWCEFPSAGRVKILRTTKGDGSGPPGRVLDDKLTIACGSGAVRLLQLQRAGKQPMGADEFLRGTPVAPATVLH